MQDDIERILIDREQIAQRVQEVAGLITQRLTRLLQDTPDQTQRPRITLVPILTGSVVFLADLIRHLPLYLRIRVMSIQSYPGKSTSSRGAAVQQELTHLPEDLAGTHVVVVDDILDSGGTMQLAIEQLNQRRPASLTTCVLLRKDRANAPKLPVDFICFEVPDRFVVGYGLDHDGYYRNLPDIVTLKSHVVGHTDTQRQPNVSEPTANA